MHLWGEMTRKHVSRSGQVSFGKISGVKRAPWATHSPQNLTSNTAVLDSSAIFCLLVSPISNTEKMDDLLVKTLNIAQSPLVFSNSDKNTVSERTEGKYHPVTMSLSHLQYLWCQLCETVGIEDGGKAGNDASRWTSCGPSSTGSVCEWSLWTESPFLASFRYLWYL